jgi:hypothetical protein
MECSMAWIVVRMGLWPRCFKVRWDAHLRRLAVGAAPAAIAVAVFAKDRAKSTLPVLPIEFLGRLAMSMATRL